MPHQPKEPNYGAYALLATFGAAVVLLVIGLILQLVVPELRGLNQLIFGGGAELPWLSKPLFEWFGLRPTSYLTAITFWFWWPFLANLVHSACYFPEPRQFARVFGFRYLMCWVAVACYLAVVGFMAALAFMAFGADLAGPPAFTIVVPIISWILPVVFVVLAARWVYRTSRIVRRPEGGIEIAHVSRVGPDGSLKGTDSEQAGATEPPRSDA
jgi:hypothetical protein